MHLRKADGAATAGAERRDAYYALAGIDAEQLAADLLKAREEKVINGCDCHTLKGKRKGKTKADFFWGASRVEAVPARSVRRSARELIRRG